MNRREAISTASILFGGAIIGSQAFLYGCKPKKLVDADTLAPDGIALMDEVGETILPATATSPGAKEAQVGAFMKTMTDDCYSPEDRKTFLDGIKKLQAASDKKHGKDFMALTADQRHGLLLDLEKEAANYKNTNAKGMQQQKPEDPENHYYPMMKQLTILGFLTSKPGATRALRHVAIPGRYDGCVPYKPGEKAWG